MSNFPPLLIYSHLILTYYVNNDIENKFCKLFCIHLINKDWPVTKLMSRKTSLLLSSTFTVDQIIPLQIFKQSKAFGKLRK